jgi:hypothetical protein
MEICPVTSFYFVGAKIQLIFKLAKNIFAKRGKKSSENQCKDILFSMLKTIKKEVKITSFFFAPPEGLEPSTP